MQNHSAEMRKAFGRFGHSELFTVRAMDTPGGGTGRSQISRACGAGEAASVLNEEHVSKGTPMRSVMLVPRKASTGSIRRGPEGTSQGKPGLHPAALCSALDYERFNSNNISVRRWSWNYRGCWHQTCPPVVTHWFVYIRHPLRTSPITWTGGVATARRCLT